MSFSQFDVDMLLLSSLVNADISKLTTDRIFVGTAAVLGAGGQDISNFIAQKNAVTTLYDVDGWEARTIDFAKITALTFGAVTTYSDMAGMVAATFVKGSEAVISFLEP